MENDNVTEKLKIRLKRVNANTKGVVSELGPADKKGIDIANLGFVSIILGPIEPTEVTFNGAEYFPVPMFFQYDNRGFFRNTSYEFLHVKEAKRVSLDKVIEKLSEVLKSEYTGSYEVVSGRYLFKFQNVDPSTLDRWKAIIKAKEGTTIDYTWLAPLQELTAYKEEKRTKTNRRKRASNLAECLKENESDKVEKDADSLWYSGSPTYSTPVLKKGTQKVSSFSMPKPHTWRDYVQEAAYNPPSLMDMKDVEEIYGSGILKEEINALEFGTSMAARDGLIAKQEALIAEHELRAQQIEAKLDRKL